MKQHRCQSAPRPTDGRDHASAPCALLTRTVMVSSLTFDLLLDLRAQLQRQHLNEATETQQQSARRCARVTPCLHTRNHAAVSTFPFRSLPPHLALLIIELCLFQLLVHDVANDELHLRQQSHHSRRPAGLRSATRRITHLIVQKKLDRVCARDCASVTIARGPHRASARDSSGPLVAAVSRSLIAVVAPLWSRTCRGTNRSSSRGFMRNVGSHICDKTKRRQ